MINAIEHYRAFLFTYVLFCRQMITINIIFPGFVSQSISALNLEMPEVKSKFSSQTFIFNCVLTFCMLSLS